LRWINYQPVARGNSAIGTELLFELEKINRA
jgi:hypothetical protein